MSFKFIEMFWINDEEYSLLVDTEIATLVFIVYFMKLFNMIDKYTWELFPVPFLKYDNSLFVDSF